MASDSDSDCELYTKTAQRVQFGSRVEEIEDIVDMAENDKERREIMKELDSGTSPMEALLRVQIDPLIKRTASHSSDSEILTMNSSSSTDITMYDDPSWSPNVKKNKTHSPKNTSVTSMVPTRASKRKLTTASTKASLLKNKKSRVHPTNDEVVVEEDQEELGSLAQGSRSNRGRRNAPSTSTIVFDDDSAYSNTITGPIDFNKPYRCNDDQLDSNNDDQLNSSKLSLSPLSSDISFDIEAPCLDDIPVKISIEWSNGKGMTRKIFQLRKYQKFESVFEDLAKLEGISVNRVLLMKQFTTISPADTPATLDMNFYGALTGFVTKVDIVHSKTSLFSLDKEETSQKKPDGAISVKVQLESKQTFVFNLGKYSKMETLYLMTCEELKCDKDELKLVFDGEYVSPNAKLSTLELEDGDVIHAHIKK